MAEMSPESLRAESLGNSIPVVSQRRVPKSKGSGNPAARNPTADGDSIPLAE